MDEAKKWTSHIGQMLDAYGQHKTHAIEAMRHWKVPAEFAQTLNTKLAYYLGKQCVDVKVLQRQTANPKKAMKKFVLSEAVTVVHTLDAEGTV